MTSVLLLPRTVKKETMFKKYFASVGVVDNGAVFSCSNVTVEQDSDQRHQDHDPCQRLIRRDLGTYEYPNAPCEFSL